MLFNSLTFFALLLPTLAVYWVLPAQSVRLWLLLAASLLFYGYHHWPSIFLLLFSIVFNYGIGRLQMRGRSKLLLGFGVGANLSLLLWFKYAAFIGENINQLVAFFGQPWAIPPIPVYLPLGISFFTFQVIAYQIDLYRGEFPAEHCLPRFAVFKCFFPQLIAGPIVRAKDFLPQLQNRAQFDAAQFHQGLWLLICGLTLKVFVADVFAQFANEAFRSIPQLSTAGAWAGLYAYAFQLYADFWGYSTMAVGTAALFGLVLPLNFETPYLSDSLREFWRRWHITLSVWLRDYLYIPLGGNRRRVYFNLILTMLLAGLWHGAGWTFLLWGLGHGVWLALERWCPPVRGLQTGWGRILKAVLVFHGVCLLWVLFRAPTFGVAWEYFGRLVPHSGGGNGMSPLLATRLVLFALAQWPLAWTLKENRFATLPLKAQWGMAVVCLFWVLAYAGAQVDFIYFTF